MLDEVLCSNPVQGFKQLTNSQFTRQISLLYEEIESNLSFKCPNVLILKVYDTQNLWINIVYSIYNNRRLRICICFRMLTANIKVVILKFEKIIAKYSNCITLIRNAMVVYKFTFINEGTRECLVTNISDPLSLSSLYSVTTGSPWLSWHEGCRQNW